MVVLDFNLLVHREHRFNLSRRLTSMLLKIISLSISNKYGRYIASNFGGTDTDGDGIYDKMDGLSRGCWFRDFQRMSRWQTVMVSRIAKDACPNEAGFQRNDGLSRCRR